MSRIWNTTEGRQMVAELLQKTAAAPILHELHSILVKTGQDAVLPPEAGMPPFDMQRKKEIEPSWQMPGVVPPASSQETAGGPAAGPKGPIMLDRPVPMAEKMVDTKRKDFDWDSVWSLIKTIAPFLLGAFGTYTLLGSKVNPWIKWPLTLGGGLLTHATLPALWRWATGKPRTTKPEPPEITAAAKAKKSIGKAREAGEEQAGKDVDLRPYKKETEITPA